MPMGARRQITFFDEPVNGGSWSPTGARKGVAYIRDSGGNENYQLEYLDPASADPVRLTDGRGRADTGVWSPDGTKYAFQWTVRTGVELRRLHRRSARSPHTRAGLRGALRRLECGRLVPGREVAAADPFRLGQRKLSLGLRPRDAREAGDRAVEGEGRPRRQLLARRQGRVLHFGPRQRVPHAALRRPRDGQGHAAHRPPEVGRGQPGALARRALPGLRRRTRTARAGSASWTSCSTRT